MLDRLVAVGMGRSTARRLLSQAARAKEGPGPGRGRRPKYDEAAQRLLERLWLLVGMPCGTYMRAMFDQWVAALRSNGELDDVDALGQVLGMSASAIDRWLRPLKHAAMPRGMSLTCPAGEHLRNSVRVRKCAGEIAWLPGLPRATRSRTAGPALKVSSRARRRWWTTRPTGPRASPRATMPNPTSAGPSTWRSPVPVPGHLLRLRQRRRVRQRRAH